MERSYIWSIFLKDPLCTDAQLTFCCFLKTHYYQNHYQSVLKIVTGHNYILNCDKTWSFCHSFLFTSCFYQAFTGRVPHKKLSYSTVIGRESWIWAEWLEHCFFWLPEATGSSIWGIKVTLFLICSAESPPFSQLVLTDEIWTLLPPTARLAVYIPLLHTSYPGPSHNRIESNKLDILK